MSLFCHTHIFIIKINKIYYSEKLWFKVQTVSFQQLADLKRFLLIIYCLFIDNHMLLWSNIQQLI